FIRFRGKSFAGRDQLRGQIIKSRGHVPSNAAPLGIVLMAEQEVHGVYLLVDKITDRIAQLDTPTILLDLLLLLSKPPKRQPQAAQPPTRTVELRTCARDRHPQRRMWLLIRLRQDGARRHGPEFSLVTERLCGPHFGQAAHELIPALLGGVWMCPEPTQFGPGRRPPRANLETSP